MLLILLSGLIAYGCRNQTGETATGDDRRIGVNRIQNGNIESVTEGAPEHWESFHFGGSPPGEHSVDFDPHSRNHALTVSLNETGAAGWRQRVHLDPDTQWVMNCRVKTESIEGAGLGALMFFPIFRYKEPLAIRNAGEWTSLTAELVNAGFVEMDLTCSLGAYGGNTGRAWFDDIVIVPQIDPARDPLTTAEAVWGPFAVRYNTERGYLTSLRPTGHETDGLPEFLGSYPTLPHLDHARDHFIGDVAVDIRIGEEWKRFTTADTGVRHGVNTTQGGLQTLHSFPAGAPAPVVSTQWMLQDDLLKYTITLTNKTGAPMVIGGIDLPFPWNNNYCLFNPHDKNSQRLLYTRRVAEHKSIGGDASCILVTPMDGRPPFLLVSPADRNSIPEFTYHSPDTIREQIRDNHRWIHGAWPGLTRLCFLSEGIVETHGWADWYYGHTQRTLDPDQTLALTLNFQWIERRADVEPALAATGALGVRLEPGPAVPIGEPVSMSVFGAVEPVSIEGAGAELLSQTALAGTSPNQLVRFRISQTGEQVLKVHDAAGKTAGIIMFGLPGIPELLNARTHFIRTRQAHTGTGDGDALDGGILCWNNRTGSVLADPRDMWGSGGYEGGITDAQFIAMKNLYFPDKAEIALLETYIHEWWIGTIQQKDTWGVAWMAGEPGRIERGYNYIHVLNLYDAMARTSDVWPDLFTYDTSHYLDLWINTFRAFNTREVNFRDLGLMGRGNMTHMPEFFRLRQREQDAQDIEAEITRWAEYWSQPPAYPYGSELFFDNTGYESVALYCDYDLRMNKSLTPEQAAARRQLIEQTISVTEAGRGRAPAWFWNDSDQRWWDAVRTRPAYRPFTDFGENCHHYMTGLNGYMLLELYDRGYNRDEPFPVGFSGLLAHFGRITDDGFAGMCYCPDPSSDNYGLNQFTGDVGLGFWGGLLGLRCYVLADASSGLRCLGGRLDTSDPDLVVLQPWPACGHRIRWFAGAEVFFDVQGLEIRSIRRSESGRRWVIDLLNSTEFACRSRLTIQGLEPGTWAVTTRKSNGKSLDSSRKEMDSSPAVFEHKSEPGNRFELTLARENEPVMASNP